MLVLLRYVAIDFAVNLQMNQFSYFNNIAAPIANTVCGPPAISTPYSSVACCVLHGKMIHYRINNNNMTIYEAP